MKREFLLVLAILTSLSIAYAQEEIVEEKILGLSVSSLLVILPIAMIVIGLIFFLGLYIKDHSQDISRLFKFKIKRQRREIKKKIIDYPKEAQTLQKRLPALDPEEAIQNLSNLAKKFFAEKFNIDYEYTHGELEKELKEEKESWASFPRNLSNLRYSGEPISKKEVAALVKEFWDIVKYEKKRKLSLTVIEKLKKKRLGFEIEILKNLKRYLQKAKPKKKEKLTAKDVLKYFLKNQKQKISNIRNIFKKVGTDTVTEINSPLRIIEKIKGYFLRKMTGQRVDNMLDLIGQAKKQISKGNIHQAKNIYHHAYGTYYKLPIEEQSYIISELQKLQEMISVSKQPVQVGKETPIGQVREYMEKKLGIQRLNEVNKIMEEAHKQIAKGNLSPAKKAYKQVYRLYYKLPIEEQAQVLSNLREIKDKISDTEKSAEKREIEELAKELGKLKSERDVYVILDKSNIQKKLDFLTRYTHKVEEQGIHGLKAGKSHLKDQLRDLAGSVRKIEKKEKKKLTLKEKNFLTQIKDIGKFYTKKEKISEEELKQRRLQKPALEPHVPPPHVAIKERKPQKEKEEFEAESLIETPKVKVNIARLKVLQQEEERVMKQLQSTPKKQLLPVQRVQKKKLGKYNWEIMADEVRRKKTKALDNLKKEEEEVLSKLNNLQ